MGLRSQEHQVPRAFCLRVLALHNVCGGLPAGLNAMHVISLSMLSRRAECCHPFGLGMVPMHGE